MAGKSKKMAAALAAVSLYLHEEETARTAQEQQVSLAPPQGSSFDQWGQSGRQEMMAMRKLIQLRAFTRF